MSRRQVISRLLSLLRPMRRLMMVSASARILNQGLGVAIPVLAVWLVTRLVEGDSISSLIAVLAGLAVVKGTLRYLEQFTGHAVAFQLLSELRIETFNKVVPLAPAGIEDERTGDLVNRVIGDIDRVEPFFAHTIAPIASGVAVPALTAVGLAIWVDPVVAVAFAPFPVAILAIPWIRAAKVRALSTTAREQAGETAAVFTDAVQGAREIEVFDARAFVTDRIETCSEAAASTRRELGVIASLRSAIVDLASAAAIVVVALTAWARFEAGLITASALAAAIVAVWVGTGPAKALEQIVPDLEQAIAAATRLFELAERTTPVGTAGTSKPILGGGVVLEDVTVDLGPASTRALRNISVEIPDRSNVAIVGPSGSGKSTLVELLVRFRDPSAGRVEIGGTDVSDIDPFELQHRVLLVPQRPDIFFGTLRDNLAMASPASSESEMWDALGNAGLARWARSLEAGLDSHVGEMGTTLSGGQRQRVALARLFLRDPSVIILDEATSELDTHTEQAVLARILAASDHRTILFVAHRLTAAVVADRVLVMDDGRLAEQGTHDELLRARGVYWGLWQRHLDVVETV